MAVVRETFIQGWGGRDNPRCPDLSGVDGWNLGQSGVEFCNFLFIHLFYFYSFCGLFMSFGDVLQSRPRVGKMIHQLYTLPFIPFVSVVMFVSVVESVSL